MEVSAVIPEDVFNKIPKELIDKFKYVNFKETNEYENNKEDTIYLEYYKRYKKARNDKDEYLFNKRHK